MADLNEFAGVVALAIKAAMAPVLERVALMESQVKSLATFDESVTALRERVVVVETKAQAPAMEVKSVTMPPDDIVSIQQRICALEQRQPPPLVDVTPLADRLAVLETKAAQPVALPEFITSGRLLLMTEKADRAVADVAELAKDFGTLRERVAVVEVRQPMPGPAGKDGAAGKDGIDGLGFDDLQMVQDGRRVTVTAVKGDRVKAVGTAVFPAVEYRDVWEAGASYERGDLTTWGGSMWHCNEPTTSKPGESKAWTLMVKRGRDGRDGKDAAPPLPVVAVHG